MVAQQGEQLAGHGGVEGGDAASLQPHPFGVGAGQADHPVQPALLAQQAEQLGLLAADDVLRAGGAAGEAGEDA